MMPKEIDLASLLSNTVFIAAAFSLFLTQLIKSLIPIVKYRRRSAKEVLTTFFWKTGGMPSSHSALVIAITTAIAYGDGLGSSTFILSLAFSIIVLRDALGVRRSSGLQASLLNAHSRELNEHFQTSLKTVKEVHGHSGMEVLIGGLLGYVIAVALCTL